MRYAARRRWSINLFTAVASRCVPSDRRSEAL